MNRPGRRSASTRVSKHYATPAGPVRAVDGITLEVEPGTSLAITGPSGCGKSTLLGLIGGLEAPTAGRVIDRRPGDLEPARARSGPACAATSSGSSSSRTTCCRS